MSVRQARTAAMVFLLFIAHLLFLFLMFRVTRTSRLHKDKACSSSESDRNNSVWFSCVAQIRLPSPPEFSIGRSSNILFENPLIGVVTQGDGILSTTTSAASKSNVARKSGWSPPNRTQTTKPSRASLRL